MHSEFPTALANSVTGKLECSLIVQNVSLKFPFHVEEYFVDRHLNIVGGAVAAIKAFLPSLYSGFASGKYFPRKVNG